MFAASGIVVKVTKLSVDRSILKPASLGVSVQERSIRLAEKMAALRVGVPGGATFTETTLLYAESPAALVARTRYAYVLPVVRPPSAKVVTVAAVVPICENVVPPSVDRSTLKPVWLVALFVQVNVTWVEDVSWALKSEGAWGGPPVVTVGKCAVADVPMPLTLRTPKKYLVFACSPVMVQV